MKHVICVTKMGTYVGLSRALEYIGVYINQVAAWTANARS